MKMKKEITNHQESANYQSALDSVSIIASFPKSRPKCCGIEMYLTGGTVGKIEKGSIRGWQCEICLQEVTDIAS